ncbi:MAG: hypothetical protein CBE00_00030 [Planctomycetaceae bacterium TMED240]|nr:hypothetical protein [Rhodopirellula sp.]OUX09097.1 MAG: hypothetical protein CBE00_00030 [Planctomycetaceae bacterium TMED240]
MGRQRRKYKDMCWRPDRECSGGGSQKYLSTIHAIYFLVHASGIRQRSNWNNRYSRRIKKRPNIRPVASDYEDAKSEHIL